MVWSRLASRPVRALAAVLALALALSVLQALAHVPAAHADGTPDLQVSASMPSGVLYGQPTPVTVTATNPPGSGAVGYNVSFRDVLPVGVSYVPGSSGTAGEPTVFEDSPAAGQTTLVWLNVADVQVGSTASVSYEVQSAVEPDGDALIPGDTFSNDASAYVNTDARYVPDFDGDGQPVAGPTSYTGSGTAQDTTTVLPFSVGKAEGSPEDELVRGLHDHATTYTLTVRNNEENATTGVTVVDHLPAGLEFLACGDVDHTTDAATNPGSTEEYAGAGSLAGPALSPNCPDPAQVETVTTDPDGDGPLASGVWTRVTWTGISLAAGETRTIRYRAGVPLRENTTDFPGGAPAPGSGQQAANLDNNGGPETTDEQELTNHVAATGTYGGPVADGYANPATAETTHTVTAEDVALRKSVSSPSFEQGSVVEWTLTVDVSEYRSASDVVLTDTLPDGLCPLGPVNYSDDSDPECDPTGDAPSVPYDTVTDNGDGTFTLTWDLGSISDSGTATVTFPATDKRFTQSGAPTVAGDGYTNRVSLTATTDPIDALSGYPAGVDVVDESSAGQDTARPSIEKQVSDATDPGEVMDCGTASYGDDEPVFQRGDRLCYQLEVTFPSTVDTRAPVVTDLLPPNVTLEPGSVTYPGGNSVAVDGLDVTDGVMTWTLGTDRDGVLYADPGDRFLVRFSVTVDEDPSAGNTFDLVDNLMKYTSQNSAGEALSLRDAATFTLSAPRLSLTKGVRDVGDDPAGGNPADTDGLTVSGGDVVTYRVDVTNDGLAEAHDTEVWDVLPPQVTCAAVSGISDDGTCDSGTTPPTLTWTGLPAIAPDATRTLTYDVTVPVTVAADEPLDNTAGVRSYAGEQNTDGLPRVTYVPADNIDGDATPTDGTPAADDPSDVVVVPASLDKTRTTELTEAGNNGAGQATVGEEVTYTVTATVPEGTTLYDAVLTDPVSDRLTLTGTPTLTVNGVPLPGGFLVDDSGGTLEVSFPPVYTNLAGSGDDTVVLSFTAVVDDEPANTRTNGSIPNQATFTWDDSQGDPRSTSPASASTTVVEPLVSVDKGDDTGDGTVSPGDTVTYTVTASNASGSRVSTAHDLVVEDVLPTGLTYVPASASDGGAYDGGSRTLTWTLDSLDPGASQDLTYEVTVDDPAVASGSYRNDVTLTATSLAGTDADERTTYADSASDTVSVVRGVVDKDVAPSSRTVGEVASFTVSATIPADVSLPDATLLDTVPDGLTDVALGTASCEAGGGGSCSPDVSPVPMTPVANADGTTGLGWALGDVAPSAEERTVTVTYTARVADAFDGGSPAGDGDASGDPSAGDALTNTTRLWWNLTDGTNPSTVPADPGATFDTSSTDATATVTVTEPSLSVDKTGSAATAVPGDTVTYTVSVQNAAGATRSDAYAVTVVDTVPEGLAPQTGTISDGGVWNAGSRTVTWTVAGPLAPGDASVFTYDVRIADSATVGAGDLENTVEVTEYAGLPGGPGTDGRAYTGPSDSWTLAPDFPALETAKTTGAGTESGTAYLEESFAWRVVVTNTATSATAFGVDLTDTLPPGWTYDTGSAQLAAPGEPVTPVTPGVTSDPGGDALAFTDLADLAGGESLTVTFTATPQTSVLTDPGVGPSNPHTNTAQAAGEDATGATGNADGPYGGGPDTAEAVVGSADLSVDKAHSGSFTPGTNETYTLDVSNGGPSPAAGPVTVTDTLPDGLTFVSGTGTGWSCSAAGQDVTCTRGADLPTGGAPTLTLTVAVDADLTGSVENTAAVGSPTYDPDPSNDEDTDPTTLQPSADLSVGKTLGGDLVPGTQATYTLDVRNLGPSDAAGPVTLTDTLPSGLTFVSASGAGWSCGDAGQDVTCTRAGVLPAGAQAGAVTLVVDVDPSVTGDVANTATVSGPTPDPVGGNDSSTETVTADTSADLSVAKELTGPLVAGSEATYEVTVANGGPSDAGTVTVTDPLPEGTSYVSGSGTGWSCGESGGEVACTRAGLAAGATAPVLTLTLLVDADHDGDVENTATVSSVTDDPVPGNDSDTASGASTRETDLSLTKSHTGDLTAGENGTYTLAVRNDGPSDVAGTVTVTDTLPTGMTFVSGTGTGWSCSADGQDVTCTRSGLAAGTDAPAISLVVAVSPSAGPGTLVNGAAVSSPSTDPQPANDGDTDPTTVLTEADLSVDKSHSGTMTAGDTGTFTLAVANDGPSDAAGPVTLTDTLPAGMTYESASGAGWDCGAAGQTVTCTRAGGVAAGADTSVTLTVRVAAGQEPDTLTNTASVASPTSDPAPGNDGDSDDVTTDTAADLRVVKSHEGDLVAGDTGVYTLAVRNLGPSDVPGTVTVTDTLPAPFTYVSGTGAGWDCDAAGQDVTCTLDSGLLAGTSAPDVALTVLVDPGTSPGSVTNTATVASAVDDPVPGNDTSEDPTDLTRASDLAVTKTALGKFVIGEEGRYVLQVTNRGPSDEPGPVTVTDTLPAGLAYAAAEGDGWSCDEADGDVTCTRAGTLPAGEDADALTLTVDVLPGAYPGVTNSATVAGTVADPVPSNDTDDAEVTVGAQADLAVEKTHDGAFSVGERGTYTVEVTNRGPTEDPGPVVVTDTLPTGMAFVSGTGPGWACEDTDGTVRCTRDDGLADGATSTVRLTVDVGPAAAPGVTNTVTVTGEATDPDGGNDTSDDPTRADPTVDVDVDKELVGDLVAGETARYRIVASNAGPSPATGVTVVDDLPAGLTYVSADGPGWDCAHAAGTVTCRHGSALAADATSGAVTLTVRVSAAAGVSVANAAVVSADESSTSGPGGDDRDVADGTVSAPSTPPGSGGDDDPSGGDRSGGDKSGGDLADTGLAVLPFLLVGLALVGTGSLLVRRRRRGRD